MTITVTVGETDLRLSELLAKVEAGEDFVITRGNQPIARLVPIENQRRAEVEKTIAAIHEFRKHVKPVTLEEILAWKHEGHRY